MATLRRSRAALGAVTFLSIAVVAGAQSAVDSTRIPVPAMPIAAWITLAAGPGSVKGSSPGLLASVFETTLSIGPALLSLRSSDLGGIFTSPRGVRETAVLAGLRSSGRRAFGTAALGLSRAQEAHGVGLDCGPSRDCPHRTALAFDLGVHANLLVPGVHASFTGVAGPADVSYTAVVVGLELGWFGR